MDIQKDKVREAIRRELNNIYSVPPLMQHRKIDRAVEMGTKVIMEWSKNVSPEIQ